MVFDIEMIKQLYSLYPQKIEEKKKIIAKTINPF